MEFSDDTERVQERHEYINKMIHEGGVKYSLIIRCKTNQVITYSSYLQGQRLIITPKPYRKGPIEGSFEVDYCLTMKELLQLHPPTALGFVLTCT